VKREPRRVSFFFPAFLCKEKLLILIHTGLLISSGIVWMME